MTIMMKKIMMITMMIITICLLNLGCFVESVFDKVALEQVFFEFSSVLACQYHSTKCIGSFVFVFLSDGQAVEAWRASKKCCLWYRTGLDIPASNR